VARNTAATIITKSDKTINLSTFSRYFMLAPLYQGFFSRIKSRRSTHILIHGAQIIGTKTMGDQRFV
jgi:hypothetical protein